MEKKRMLMVMEALQLNGAVKGLLDFLQVVDRNEYDIDLFLFDNIAHDGFSIPIDVRVLPYDIHCLIERVGLREALGVTLKKGRIDLFLKRIVYSVLQKYFLSFRKWNLARPAACQKKIYDVAIGGMMGATWEYVARKVDARCKLLWLDTNVHFEPWPKYWHCFKKYIDSASGLVCVSESIRNMMREENPQWRSKIFTVNYVIDEARIRELAQHPSQLPTKRAFRLVTVGRYCLQKGQQYIPEIAASLKRQGLDFEWYVIAPGYSPYWSAIQKELNRFDVSANVIYHEGVPNPFAEMRTADLYVQPSVYEGYGLTVSEALITGRYVVATDIPQFREQIVDNGIGRVAELEPEVFSRVIIESARFVQGGHNRHDYVTPYTAVRTYAQFREIFEKTTPNAVKEER